MEVMIFALFLVLRILESAACPNLVIMADEGIVYLSGVVTKSGAWVYGDEITTMPVNLEPQFREVFALQGQLHLTPSHLTR